MHSIAFNSFYSISAPIVVERHRSDTPPAMFR
jgi:hypothetical protein